MARASRYRLAEIRHRSNNTKGSRGRGTRTVASPAALEKVGREKAALLRNVEGMWGTPAAAFPAMAAVVAGAAAATGQQLPTYIYLCGGLVVGGFRALIGSEKPRPSRFSGMSVVRRPQGLARLVDGLLSGMICTEPTVPAADACLFLIRCRVPRHLTLLTSCTVIAHLELHLLL
ncbi:hypothetical protein B0I35DRAFT_15984 [Stachybotrys elegans]|uniref:Uncharacterized protein n=1 Tax=Stachybotrys elegans TaxID=80388 RepID=A0A8K0T0N6_9HYPO|nr:hypothetical protein B0I35DRAFT_15984 [Stachybotrys elegans]